MRECLPHKACNTSAFLSRREYDAPPPRSSKKEILVCVTLKALRTKRLRLRVHIFEVVLQEERKTCYSWGCFQFYGKGVSSQKRIFASWKERKKKNNRICFVSKLSKLSRWPCALFVQPIWKQRNSCTYLIDVLQHINCHVRFNSSPLTFFKILIRSILPVWKRKKKKKNSPEG